ncbi:MAG: hypothetical protein IJO94_00835, partial [Firmicutes bacterium]|nr:hypothetical protein [Bacillota bacterium]
MKKKLILTTILSVLLICCFSTGGFAMEVFSVDESQCDIDSSVELSSVQPLTQDRTAYFSRNYTLTNDPGTNMARIAQAQVGKNYANL